MAAQLLKEHELFELLPAHGKVVTLDADLPMKHALDALSSHSATCLPVWDSHQQRFVDVFTCSDLVDIVLFTHRALAAGAAGPRSPRAPPYAAPILARSAPSPGFTIAAGASGAGRCLPSYFHTLFITMPASLAATGMALYYYYYNKGIPWT